MTAELVLDLFAGPGGWDEGAKPLAIKPVGIEWDEAACRTGKAAGHTRVRADVAALPTAPMRGRVRGLIASPPCQDFSMAGKRAGITGDKGQLIAQVLRYTDDLRPEWVACEQVPPCLAIWETYAEVMRSWGYRTWTGVLNAADYGVPQTRKRAFLLASRSKQPSRPMPTHSREPSMFTAVWVSMADALGWGLDERPAFTVTTAGGGDTGGVEVFASKHSRDTLRMHAAGRTGLAPPRDPAERPSDTITGKGTAVWAYSRPATTVVASFGRVSVPEVSVLQSFPADYPWQGSKTKQYQQVGNAVPPLLAQRVLEAVL